jgi:hypothetical protein
MSCTEQRPDAGGQVLGGFPTACLTLKVIKREFVEPGRRTLPGLRLGACRTVSILVRQHDRQARSALWGLEAKNEL